MFRLKNKKAQSTAEYVIVLGLVVAAVMAMQTYIKRGLQGRIKDVVDYKDNAGQAMLFSTNQYEPNYINSTFSTNRASNETENSVSGGAVNRTTNEGSSRVGTQKIERVQ